jgi:hypothetical protein
MFCWSSGFSLCPINPLAVQSHRTQITGFPKGTIPTGPIAASTSAHLFVMKNRRDCLNCREKVEEARDVFCGMGKGC